MWNHVMWCRGNRFFVDIGTAQHDASQEIGYAAVFLQLQLSRVFVPFLFLLSSPCYGILRDGTLTLCESQVRGEDEAMEVDEEGRDIEGEEDDNDKDKDGKGEEEEDLPDDLNLDNAQEVRYLSSRLLSSSSFARLLSRHVMRNRAGGFWRLAG